MIAREWRAWASPAGADGYERYYAEVVVPELEALPGFAGATLLRREAGAEVEVVSITTFESMEAVHGFAGPDASRAVVHERARSLLTRFDETATHYEVVLTTR
ncbi:MAG TPA: antibiotic biosynthesis monooxygenase [Candidatus Dormibacteraeota bacterium]|nr:antibiotic biosynthesis monooxygenase [Candidatus Dormibacteraeota bacterium]